jgi:hypothetical protein
MCSPKAHWHGEGIRLVNLCCKNIIENNRVHDVKAMGFGITADLHADYNIYRGNTCENVEAIAYTDQKGDSHNEWSGNMAKNCAIGYDFASFWQTDNPEESLSEGIIVKDNQAVNCANGDCVAGWVKSIHFSGNNFKQVFFSRKLLEYFPRSGSTWDGKPDLPDYVKEGYPSRFVKIF